MKTRYIFLLIALLCLSIFAYANYFDYTPIFVGCVNEVCDGVDNDCDGIVDEFLTKSCTIQNPNPTLGTCNGTQVCGYGLWLSCDISTMYFPPERCNNLDEDCDGQVDEAWPNKGSSCGNCGTLTCNSSGNGLACVGEGVCSQGDKEITSCGTSNEGECTLGLKEKICSNSCGWNSWSSCNGNIEPRTEVCEGIKDEDCDGVVDNGCVCTNGTTKACGSDVGECSRGSQTCVNGNWSSTCVGEIKESGETCDNKDNDCDGTIDNLDSRSCGEHTQGTCSLGTQSCSRGQWSTCNSINPLIEICDGILDEDCDGRIDEGCECTNKTTKTCGDNTGECTTGLQLCVNGAWSGCQGNTLPKTETCDGIKDEDCDGQVDEGCVCTNETTKTCGSSIGICSTGTQTCTNGLWTSECNGELLGQNEVCDGLLDEDCDGEVDEGCICTNGTTKNCGSNTGECVAGTQTCTNGVWPDVCVGENTGSAETCDNVDNDCDGTLDEGCDCTDGTIQPCGSNTGECTTGTQTCNGGKWSDCQGNTLAKTETCDGLKDEDCDGITDEDCACVNGTQQACGSNFGLCEKGIQDCVNGAWQDCNGINQVNEICDNGLDEDCDGVIDNGCVVNQQAESTYTSPVGDDTQLRKIDPVVDDVLQTSDGTTNYDDFFITDNFGSQTTTPTQKFNVRATNYNGATNIPADAVSTISAFILEKEGKGKIVFDERIVLNKNINLDEISRITDNEVFINSQTAPELNKPARITIESNIVFPIILKNGLPCPEEECKIISIENGKVEFDVEGFSTYSIGDLDAFLCNTGAVSEACICEAKTITQNYCCGGLISIVDCSQGIISPVQTVNNCFPAVEGKCVNIGSQRGTCTNGVFTNGCASDNRSNRGLIAMVIENQLIVFGLIGAIVVIIIIFLIVKKVGGKKRFPKAPRSAPTNIINEIQQERQIPKQKRNEPKNSPIQFDDGDDIFAELEKELE